MGTITREREEGICRLLIEPLNCWILANIYMRLLLFHHNSHPWGRESYLLFTVRKLKLNKLSVQNHTGNVWPWWLRGQVFSVFSCSCIALWYGTYIRGCCQTSYVRSALQRARCWLPVTITLLCVLSLSLQVQDKLSKTLHGGELAVYNAAHTRVTLFILPETEATLLIGTGL